jgi:hypothetical protein
MMPIITMSVRREFVALSTICPSPMLERASIGGQVAWVQQGWACVNTDDIEYMRWIRPLDKVPTWAVLLGTI